MIEPISAPRKSNSEAMYGTERMLQPIPLTELRVLGRVASDFYAEHAGTELRIRSSRYYPPSASDADLLILELLPGDDSGRSFGQIGGGRRPPEPLEVLHEAWRVPAGSYAEAAAAWERRRNPPPPPMLPVLAGPSVAELTAGWDKRGVTYRVEADGIALAAERGRILDSDRQQARQYAPLLADPKHKCGKCQKERAVYVVEVGRLRCERCATEAVKR